jgi:hypothetical protein
MSWQEGFKGSDQGTSGQAVKPSSLSSCQAIRPAHPIPDSVLGAWIWWLLMALQIWRVDTINYTRTAILIDRYGASTHRLIA